MNPLSGILLIALGSIAAASFYVPFKKVKNWAWESYWLSQGIAAWLVAPMKQLSNLLYRRIGVINAHHIILEIK